MIAVSNKLENDDYSSSTMEISVLFGLPIWKQVESLKRLTSELDSWKFKKKKYNELCEKQGVTMVCEWDSLENFNKTTLESTVSGAKKDIKKRRTVGGSIAGGAALVATAGAGLYFLIRRKK